MFMSATFQTQVRGTSALGNPGREESYLQGEYKPHFQCTVAWSRIFSARDSRYPCRKNIVAEPIAHCGAKRGPRPPTQKRHAADVSPRGSRAHSPNPKSPQSKHKPQNNPRSTTHATHTSKSPTRRRDRLDSDVVFPQNAEQRLELWFLQPENRYLV